jgi:hypothetical protein
LEALSTDARGFVLPHSSVSVIAGALFANSTPCTAGKEKLKHAKEAVKCDKEEESKKETK